MMDYLPDGSPPVGMAVRFVLGKKENSAIAELLMNFILKNKAKRRIFTEEISV